LEKNWLDKLTVYRTLYGLLAIGTIKRKIELLAKLIEKIKRL